jgi:hypothetical protein
VQLCASAHHTPGLGGDPKVMQVFEVHCYGVVLCGAAGVEISSIYSK